MRNILIFIESRFPVNRKRIREVVNKFLDQERLRNKVEVGIAVVGDRKMRELNKKYRNNDETTTVLSFALDNPLEKTQQGDFGFIYPPDDYLRLGDVIISYPQTVLRSVEDQILVDDKIDELLIHGLTNLIGKTTQ